jgi:alpha-L-rhamnosidase
VALEGSAAGLINANSSFSTGLLAQGDWNASAWVVAEVGWTAAQMRKQFHLPAGRLVRARLFAAIPGYGRIFVNGQKVDGEAGTRTMTQFDRSVRYHTYDITSLLSEVSAGVNALGLHLGRGAYGRYGYGPPAARVLLRATVVDRPQCSAFHTQVACAASPACEWTQWTGGTCVPRPGGNENATSAAMFVLGTDGSWTQHPGPFVKNDEFQGVTYDARRQTPGWASPGYSPTAGWGPVLLGSANIATPGVYFKLTHTLLLAAEAPPVKVMHRLAPLQTTSPDAGVAVFDFGQNLAGWTRLTIVGQKGAQIRLRHAEILTHKPYSEADGGIDLDGLTPTANQTDVYILSGDPSGEIFEGWMTQHGFRYVECTLLVGSVDVWPPSLDNLEALAVRSGVSQTGTIAFGDELANKIQRNVLWGQGDNLMMVPTGCDQRSERQGWTGDSGVTADEVSLNFDMGGFCESSSFRPRPRLPISRAFKIQIVYCRSQLAVSLGRGVISQRCNPMHCTRSSGYNPTTCQPIV